MGGCTGNPAAEYKATPAAPASEADAAAAPHGDFSSMAVLDVVGRGGGEGVVKGVDGSRPPRSFNSSPQPRS